MDALENVLYITEEPANRLICRNLIKTSGFAKEVNCLSSGKEAVNYYLKLIGNPLHGIFPPDLIVLDLDPPDNGAWKFLKRFTQLFLPIFPDTKVVVTSRFTDPKDFDKAFQYPFLIDFLNKAMTQEYLWSLRLKMMVMNRVRDYV